MTRASSLGGSLSVADVLERAADLIEPEGRYCDGWGARDARGDGVGWGDKRATCWSAFEAIYRVCRFASLGDPAMFFFRIFLGLRSIRGQADAVAKLREAAALARAQPDASNEA